LKKLEITKEEDEVTSVIEDKGEMMSMLKEMKAGMDLEFIRFEDAANYPFCDRGTLLLTQCVYRPAPQRLSFVLSRASRRRPYHLPMLTFSVALETLTTRSREFLLLQLGACPATASPARRELRSPTTAFLAKSSSANLTCLTEVSLNTSRSKYHTILPVRILQ
jgi:hypothetical protein